MADQYEAHAEDKEPLGYWREAFGAVLLSEITPDRIAKQRDMLQP